MYTTIVIGFSPGGWVFLCCIYSRLGPTLLDRFSSRGHNHFLFTGLSISPTARYLAVSLPITRIQVEVSELSLIN